MVLGVLFKLLWDVGACGADAAGINNIGCMTESLWLAFKLCM